MRLGDVYKHKECNDIIQIDSFATPINEMFGDMIIICRHITKSCGMYGSSPSFNSYGKEEDIEEEYELIATSEELKEYGSWEDLFVKFGG